MNVPTPSWWNRATGLSGRTCGAPMSSAPCLPTRAPVMRHETRRVLGDERLVFAHAHARRLVAHHPRSDQRVTAHALFIGELGQRGHRLQDGGAVGVIAPAGHALPIEQAHVDVGTLAREQVLAHPTGGHRRGGLAFVLEMAGQQVGMAREPLPQQGQHALVAQDGLPRRLDELHGGGGQVLGKFVLEHVLEGVKLEEQLNGVVFLVHKLLVVAVPADVFHVQHVRAQAGLVGAIAQVIHRAPIFHRTAAGRQVKRLLDGLAQAGKGQHQLVLDGIELIGTARQHARFDLFFQPNPLEQGGFVEGGGRVVVELKQLGRPPAVVGKVHAAVEVGIATLVGMAHQVPHFLRNAQAGEQRFAVHCFGHDGHGHFVEFLGGVFDVLLHLVEGETVSAALVPIALTIDGVKLEPQILSGLFPMGTFGQSDALHENSGWLNRLLA